VDTGDLHGARVSTEGFGRQYPLKTSVGTKQRVPLARAPIETHGVFREG
jgi:ABC-type nitrate/sulfonate/bicarbonate transport system ATPase subunit